MKIEVIPVDNGLKFNFNNKIYNLTYPKKIWNEYPENIKPALIDNLAHLLTINTPLIAKQQKLEYNTSRPLFKHNFDKLIIGNIPNAVEDYEESTEDAMERFLDINYIFKKGIKLPNYKDDLEYGALVPLSLGKDSLTTFSILNEIGFPCSGLYINDTVSPSENRIKLKFLNKLKKSYDINIVTNQVEKLNDFEFWNQDETCLGYTHMTTGFCLISLPFLHKLKYNSIILGNQQDMNFSFINKDGFKAYPSYDQTKIGMEIQNEIIQEMTNSQANVYSIIEPLTNISLMKILHNRYKDMSKFQVSCDSLDSSPEKRWCHDCTKCARVFLMMRATDGDVKLVGFKDDLFKKQYKKHYALFDGNVDCYEKSTQARDQQLLSFYLSYRKGIKGYLIDLFKKEYLKEAKEREEDLFDTFFNIYPSNIPNGIKSEVKSIYKEELQEV